MTHKLIKHLLILFFLMMYFAPSIWAVDDLEDRVQVILYSTLKYKDFQNKNSFFDGKNVELFVRAKLTDRLTAYTEIEFEGVATTVAGARQGAVEVEQGWLQYDINEYFNPRFGVILVPFGNFNLQHFDPFRDLTDRPLMARRVIPTTWAEAGAGFVGGFFLGDEVSVDYQVYVIQGLTAGITDRGLRGARGAFRADNNNNKGIAGRLAISPFEDQEIAISGYTGEYDAVGNSIRGVDFDWTFTWGPAEFLGEYAYFGVDKNGTVPSQMQGYYLQANYHFWFDSLNDTFMGEGFADPTFTAIIRWGEAHIADDSDGGVFTNGDNEEERLTIGLNYRPVESFVFKVEYQFNTTENETLANGNNDGFLASVSAAF